MTDDSTPPDPPDDSAGAPASEPPDRWRPPGDRPPGAWPPPPAGDPPPEAEWRSEPDSGPLPSRPGSSSGWPGDRYEMPPPGQRVFDSYEAPAGRPGPEPDADRTEQLGRWAESPHPNRGGGADPGFGQADPGAWDPPAHDERQHAPGGFDDAPASRAYHSPGEPSGGRDLWGSAREPGRPPAPSAPGAPDGPTSADRFGPPMSAWRPEAGGRNGTGDDRPNGFGGPPPGSLEETRGGGFERPPAGRGRFGDEPGAPREDLDDDLPQRGRFGDAPPQREERGPRGDGAPPPPLRERFGGPGAPGARPAASRRERFGAEQPAEPPAARGRLGEGPPGRPAGSRRERFGDEGGPGPGRPPEGFGDPGGPPPAGRGPGAGPRDQESPSWPPPSGPPGPSSWGPPSPSERGEAPAARRGAPAPPGRPDAPPDRDRATRETPGGWEPAAYRDAPPPPAGPPGGPPGGPAGAYPGAPRSQPPPRFAPAARPSSGMSGNAMAALTYAPGLLGAMALIIGWILSFQAMIRIGSLLIVLGLAAALVLRARDRRNREVSFHAVQSIALDVVASSTVLVTLVVIPYMKLVSSLLFLVPWFGYVAAKAYLLIRAMQGMEARLPVIGDIGDLYSPPAGDGRGPRP